MVILSIVSQPVTRDWMMKGRAQGFTGERTRLSFLDQSRGLIMLFMALDHALYFWSSGRISNEGLPLLAQGTVQYNSPGASSWLGFAVALLSSLCAPGFLFISGYVLSLSVKRRRETGMPEAEIDKYLGQRGLILIALQVFAASMAFNLPMFSQNRFSDFTIGTLLSLSVLSTIGIGFILLIVGRRLAPGKLLGITTALFLLGQVVLPNLTRMFPAADWFGQGVINIFFLPVPFSAENLVNNNFPVLSWLLPLTLGWFFGETYDASYGIRREAKRFALAGSVSLSLFLLLRLEKMGDYLIPQGTVQSFFILSKYPPSLDYFLFYLGILFLLFAFLIMVPKPGRILGVFEGFGRTPLLFYIAHLWLYALVPMAIGFNRLSLDAGVGIWLLGLTILYPLCLGYQNRRISVRQHRQMT